MEIRYYHILPIVLLLCLILWRFSRVFRFFARNGYFYIMFMGTALCTMPFSIWRPGNVANLRLIQSWLNLSFRPVGINYAIKNHHNMKDSKGPGICIMNHQSNLDMIGLFRVSPTRFSVLAKKELFYALYFGVACWLVGIVFIDRLNPEKARGTMDRTAKHIVKESINLWIFPEGTRNKGDGMLPFRKGAFFMAVQAQCPIYPVVFSSYKHFLNTSRLNFERGTVIASCLPPIPTKGLSQNDVGPLTDKIRQLMLDEYNKITAEAQSGTTIQASII